MDQIFPVLGVVAATSAFYFLKQLNEEQHRAAFKPTKKLSMKDQVILQMLTENECSATDKRASWVLTDPGQPDNPIVHCSPGFSALTQYPQEEVENRNCRFLQGKLTSDEVNR